MQEVKLDMHLGLLLSTDKIMHVTDLLVSDLFLDNMNQKDLEFSMIWKLNETVQFNRFFFIFTFSVP